MGLAVSQISGENSEQSRGSQFLPALRSQINVLRALVLHDIKSRFFGNGIGYILMIIWPAVHMAVIVGVNFFAGHIFYGSSQILYAATGVYPFICWNYISRFCLMAVVQNKQYLSYSMVKVLDLMIARIFLEMVGMFIILVVATFVFLLVGVDLRAVDPEGVFCGVMSAVFLGIGFGLFNGSIAMIFPMWNTVYIFFIIVGWLSSGFTINPEGMPDYIADWFAYNPLLHSIEWVRSSYYLDYPHRLLNKSYVIQFGFVTTALGLVLQRILARYQT